MARTCDECFLTRMWCGLCTTASAREKDRRILSVAAPDDMCSANRCGAAMLGREQPQSNRQHAAQVPQQEEPGHRIYPRRETPWRTSLCRHRLGRLRHDSHLHSHLRGKDDRPSGLEPSSPHRALSAPHIRVQRCALKQHSHREDASVARTSFLRPMQCWYYFWMMDERRAGMWGSIGLH